MRPESCKRLENRTSITDTGTGPLTIESVTGSITLGNLQGAAGVKLVPLDGAGRPGGPAATGVKAGANWRIPIGGVATPWYLVRVRR